MSPVFLCNRCPAAGRRHELARAEEGLARHLARHGTADVDGELAYELGVGRQALRQAAAGLAMREELQLTSGRTGRLVAMTNERFAVATFERARRLVTGADPAAATAGQQRISAKHNWFSLDVRQPEAAKSAGGAAKHGRKILPGSGGWLGVPLAGLD